MNQCSSCNRLLFEDNQSCPFCTTQTTSRVARTFSKLGVGASVFVLAACYGQPMEPVELIDADGDGYPSMQGDCDDYNPSIYPGAEEICDELDNNCDNLVDQVAYYLDSDGDGDGDYATELVVDVCEPPEAETLEGYVTNRNDCNDQDANIYYGADEICDDQIDNDCDGFIDNDDWDCEN